MWSWTPRTPLSACRLVDLFQEVRRCGWRGLVDHLMDHHPGAPAAAAAPFAGCGSVPLHASMACRQTIEQLTNMPVS